MWRANKHLCDETSLQMKTQLAYLTHNHSTKVIVTTPFLNSLAIGGKTVVHINKSSFITDTVMDLFKT